MKPLLLFLTLSAFQGLAQRIPVIEHYRDSANTTQFKVTVPRDSLLYGPWVTIGTHSYQNWVQTMWGKNDSAYTTKITFIYMVGTVKAPERIQGIDFAEQSGIVVEDTILGFIEPGDWVRYLGRDLTNKNRLAFQYSYGNAEAGRGFEVRLDSLTGPVVGQWTHKTTGNWNTWTQDVIDLAPAVGIHELWIVFVGDSTGESNYVMNVDWIELRREDE